LVLIANQYVLVYRTNNNLFYNRYTKSERRSQINKAEQVKENYKEEEEITKKKKKNEQTKTEQAVVRTAQTGHVAT